MKKLVYIIAVLLQWPLMVIFVVSCYISVVFSQTGFWLCYLLTKMFDYAGDYRKALEWVEIAEKIK